MSEAHVVHALSTAELERRWGLLRTAMAARDEGPLDALVVQGAQDWLGGYVRWLTDAPATNAYPRSVVFPAAGGLTVVEQGPFDGRRDPAGDPAYRGVAEVLTTPSYAAIQYTGGYDAELVLDALRRGGHRRVGLVCTAAMYAPFVERLRAAPGLELVDATDLVDPLKAVKSAEELELVQRAATLQDAVIAEVAAFLRPGLRDFEVTAHAQHAAQARGSEQGIFLHSSAPLGTAAVFRPRWAQGRELQAGDHLTLLVEVNGPGGMYAEIARTFVLGRASGELREACAAMVEAQDATLRRLVPGAAPADVLAAHNGWLRAHGLPEEHRLFCHGQGYDMVERPLVRHDEPLPLAAGMNLAVHPGFQTERVWMTVCDNYVIGPDGPGACLHRTPKEVIEVA